MHKNIVICCDGTGDVMRPDNKSVWTNVAKVHESLRGDDRENALYIPGIATHGLIERALGPVTGYGIAENIKDAYRHICSLYTPYQDHIYLFGFSRGAYTVRSLAGFVRRVGLLLKDQSDELIELAYSYYWWGEEVGDYDPMNNLFHKIELPDEPKDHQRILIYFIGVWDSVAALGPPGVLQRIAQRFNYHDVELPDHVSHAYQALALHELRDCFVPVFWSTRSKAETMEQVWFAGAHADVGGGYAEVTLSDIALIWMQNKAWKADATQQQLKIEVGANTGLGKPHAGRIPHQPENTIKDWFQGFVPQLRALFRHEYADDALGEVWDTVRLHESVKTHWQNQAARDYRYDVPAVNEQLRKIDDRSLRFYIQRYSEERIGFAAD